MSVLILALGLLVSGAFGFIAGAKPAWIIAPFGRDRKSGDPASAQRIMDLLYPLAAAFFAGFVFSTLVPHALFHSKGTIGTFIAGVVVMGILSKAVFKRDPCCESSHDHRGFGTLSLLAMSVCSLNDGFIIGLLNPAWFSGLNLGMVVHKVTSSFAIAQVLGRSRYKGAALAWFGVGYTLLSPASLLAAGSPGLQGFSGGDQLLAFSAGLLAYMTVGSLVPHAIEILKHRPKAAYGFALAFLISIYLGFWHTSLHQQAEGKDALKANGRNETGRTDSQSQSETSAAPSAEAERP